MPASEIGRLETFLAKRFQEKCIERVCVFCAAHQKQTTKTTLRTHKARERSLFLGASQVAGGLTNFCLFLYKHLLQATHWFTL
jgi:hypothetical protein